MANMTVRMQCAVFPIPSRVVSALSGASRTSGHAAFVTPTKVPAGIAGVGLGASPSARRLPGLLLRARRSQPCAAGVGQPPDDLTAAVNTEQTCRVTFCMLHSVAFGEQLKVVGDGEVLGEWDLKRAPTMTWGEGDKWTLDLDMPGGSYDFKFVVQRDGGPDEESDWEAGTNRSLLVPNMPTSSAIIVNGRWSDTSSAFLSMSLDDDDELEVIWAAALDKAQKKMAANREDGAAPFQESNSSSDSSSDSDGSSDESVGVSEEEAVASAERAVPGGDEGYLRTPLTPDDLPEVTDEELRNQPDATDEPMSETVSTDEAPVAPGDPSTDQSAAPVGAGGNSQPSDDAQPAGDKPATSKEPVASEQPAPPPSHASDGGSPDASSNNGSSTDTGSSSGGGGGGGGKSDGALKYEAPAADALSSAAQAVAGAADVVGTQVAQTAMNAAVVPDVEPQGASQLETAGGAAGLAAVGIVAWSLATLKDTGCGLPPGPGGVLGALEGLSYLAVVALAGLGVARRVGGRGGGGRGDPSTAPAGPAALLAVAQAGSFSVLGVGLVVLVLQVVQRGFVPSALPDSKCYGEGAANAVKDEKGQCLMVAALPIRGSGPQLAAVSLQSSQAAVTARPALQRPPTLERAPPQLQPVEYPHCDSSAPSTCSSQLDSSKFHRTGSRLETFSSHRVWWFPVSLQMQLQMQLQAQHHAMHLPLADVSMPASINAIVSAVEAAAVVVPPLPDALPAVDLTPAAVPPAALLPQPLEVPAAEAAPATTPVVPAPAAPPVSAPPPPAAASPVSPAAPGGESTGAPALQQPSPVESVPEAPRQQAQADSSSKEPTPSGGQSPGASAPAAAPQQAQAQAPSEPAPGLDTAQVKTAETPKPTPRPQTAGSQQPALDSKVTPEPQPPAPQQPPPPAKPAAPQPTSPQPPAQPAPKSADSPKPTPPKPADPPKPPPLKPAEEPKAMAPKAADPPKPPPPKSAEEPKIAAPRAADPPKQISPKAADETKPPPPRVPEPPKQPPPKPAAKPFGDDRPQHAKSGFAGLRQTPQAAAPKATRSEPLPPAAQAASDLAKSLREGFRSAVGVAPDKLSARIRELGTYMAPDEKLPAVLTAPAQQRPPTAAATAASRLQIAPTPAPAPVDPPVPPSLLGKRRRVAAEGGPGAKAGAQKTLPPQGSLRSGSGGVAGGGDDDEESSRPRLPSRGEAAAAAVGMILDTLGTGYQRLGVTIVTFDYPGAMLSVLAAVWNAISTAAYDVANADYADIGQRAGAGLSFQLKRASAAADRAQQTLTSLSAEAIAAAVKGALTDARQQLQDGLAYLKQEVLDIGKEVERDVENFNAERAFEGAEQWAAEELDPVKNPGLAGAEDLLRNTFVTKPYEEIVIPLRERLDGAVAGLDGALAGFKAALHLTPLPEVGLGEQPALEQNAAPAPATAPTSAPGPGFASSTGKTAGSGTTKGSGSGATSSGSASSIPSTATKEAPSPASAGKMAAPTTAPADSEGYSSQASAAPAAPNSKVAPQTPTSDAPAAATHATAESAPAQTPAQVSTPPAQVSASPAQAPGETLEKTPPTPAPAQTPVQGAATQTVQPAPASLLQPEQKLPQAEAKTESSAGKATSSSETPPQQALIVPTPTTPAAILLRPLTPSDLDGPPQQPPQSPSSPSSSVQQIQEPVDSAAS